jgi:hypothetical protein
MSPASSTPPTSGTFPNSRIACRNRSMTMTAGPKLASPGRPRPVYSVRPSCSLPSPPRVMPSWTWRMTVERSAASHPRLLPARLPPRLPRLPRDAHDRPSVGARWSNSAVVRTCRSRAVVRSASFVRPPRPRARERLMTLPARTTVTTGSVVTDRLRPALPAGTCDLQG